MTLVRGHALRGAIELQDRVDTDFPDALRDGGLMCVDGEFPLVFAAAEFAFDGDVRAIGEGACEIGKFPEGHARCHSVRDSVDPASFFQRSLISGADADLATHRRWSFGAF